MSLVLTNVETEQSATVAVWPVSWSFRGLFIADGGGTLHEIFSLRNGGRVAPNRAAPNHVKT